TRRGGRRIRRRPLPGRGPRAPGGVGALAGSAVGRRRRRARAAGGARTAGGVTADSARGSDRRRNAARAWGGAGCGAGSTCRRLSAAGAAAGAADAGALSRGTAGRRSIHLPGDAPADGRGAGDRAGRRVATTGTPDPRPGSESLLGR